MKKSIIIIFIGLLPLLSAYAKPLVLILDWTINPDHAPVFLAKELGYFKKLGLQVDIVPPSNAADGPKLVAAKKADIAIDYQPQLLLQVHQGLPLIRFATLVDKPLSCLVALDDGPIHTISDLRGKRIAYSPGFGQVMLAVMLQHHGLSLDDTMRVGVNYNLVQALLAHNVDAFTGGMRNVEPYEIAQAGKKARLFLPEKNGIPSYDELIFVTNKIEVNDPRLQKFTKAIRQAVSYLQKHPKKSWELFITNYPELNNPVNRASWFASINIFDRQPGKISKKRYARFAHFLQRAKIISKVMPMSSYAKAT